MTNCVFSVSGDDLHKEVTKLAAVEMDNLNSNFDF